MTRLPPCTAAQVIRALERAGWQFRNATGSHRRYTHPTRGDTIVVAYHRGGLKRGTLHGILNSAGLTVDEFIALL